MYSSTTRWSSSTIITLRVVWKTRSSSQVGFALSMNPATRLCSRRNTTFMIVLPIVELPCSNPTANTLLRRAPSRSVPSASAFRRSARITSSSHVSSCSVSSHLLWQSSESGSPGFTKSLSNVGRVPTWRPCSNRNLGNSCPSMSWLFSRPRSPFVSELSRSMSVFDSSSP